jgi:hypothetical protein
MTAVPVGASVGAATWSAAWADALGELEMTVDEAEALLHAAHAPAAADLAGAVRVVWTPPSHLGQLPAPLVERATALLQRQLRVAAQLAEAAAHSRRQLRAVETMRATAEASPVYIDTDG